MTTGYSQLSFHPPPPSINQLYSTIRFFCWAERGVKMMRWHFPPFAIGNNFIYGWKFHRIACELKKSDWCIDKFPWTCSSFQFGFTVFTAATKFDGKLSSVSLENRLLCFFPIHSNDVILFLFIFLADGLMKKILFDPKSLA